MLFPGRIYIARGPWRLENFCKIFQPNISEDQKKSYNLRAGPWHLAIWKIRCWLLHYVRKKLRWGPEIATCRTKILDFTLVIRLNWLKKIELRKVRWAPWSSILFIVNCCCTRVLLHAKMLKRNWKWKNKIFLSNFCRWWHFNWGVPGPLLHSPGYVYDFEIRLCP